MSDRPLPRSLRPLLEPRDYTDQEADKTITAERDMKDRRLREVESAILSTSGGREWLWGVLNGADLFEDRMPVSGSGYEQGYYNGKQAVARGMERRFAKVSPKNFALMFIENDHR